MSPLSQLNEKAWYAQINCPKYFDFTKALTAPCSLDLQYNPPLHHFVYESDEESDNFFRNAEASPASPAPKRTQEGMLNPRYFGKPVHRHRPEISFEEYLRQYRMGQTKGHGNADVLGEGSLDDNSASSSIPYHATKQAEHAGLPSLKLLDVRDPEEPDSTAGITTPTHGALHVAVFNRPSSRRTAKQYTPSRNHNPSNLVKSLFLTPSPSPLRRAHRNARSLRITPPLPSEPAPSSPQHSHSDSAQGPSNDDTTKTFGKTANILRPPTRTTPQLSGSSGSSANSNPPSRSLTKSRPHIERQRKKSPDMPGLPQRTVGSSGSTASSSSSASYLPRTSQPSQEADSKSLGKPTHFASESKHSPPPEAIMELPWPQSSRKQVSISVRIPSTPKEQKERRSSAELLDPELLRKLKEHNRRLRKSGRHIPSEMLDLTDELQDEAKEAHVADLGPKGDVVKPKVEEYENVRKTLSKPKEPLKQLAAQPIGQLKKDQSLQDLLSSENNKVLQERKQRLPERRKAILQQCMEGQKGGLRTRTSAKVEFTSSKLAQKQGQQRRAKTNLRKEVSVGATRFSSDISKRRNGNPAAAPVPRPLQKRGVQGFKMKTKSINKTIPSADQNSNPKAINLDDSPVLRPLQRRGVQGFKMKTRSINKTIPSADQNSNPKAINLDDSRSNRSNESVTEKMKTHARQKGEQERIENDLKSLLSQHNSKVQGKRRGRT